VEAEITPYIRSTDRVINGVVEKNVKLEGARGTANTFS
jgi:hypothetical protein